jgi:glutamate 5-kinase
MNIAPKSIPEKQAAAAVGQILLMNEYVSFFGQKGFQVGQLLLTKDCIESPIKRQNTLQTLTTLLRQSVIPIINENDTVATDEIGVKFGDNDELSSNVAQLIGADQLILLTDTDGVYTANPKKDATAKRIDTIEAVTPDILGLVDDIQNTRSRGGMTSKLTQAKNASQAGIQVVIANGKNPTILKDIFDKKSVGTTILAKRGAK